MGNRCVLADGVGENRSVTSAFDIYFAALVDAAQAATGSELAGGTVIAPDPDRLDGGSATSYPTPSGTIIWCDPKLANMLVELLDGCVERAISSNEFAQLATGAGAKVLGFGRNRVLDGPLRTPSARPLDGGLAAKRLDCDAAGDVALLAVLAAAVSDDDLDEADLDFDNLDPFYVGLFAGDQLVAYACGRPSEIHERFDDVGVLVHAEHRRRGLGASAVAQFIQQRRAADPERLMLYRCTTENVGSNGIAESLGFSLAHTVGAVRFPK